MNLFCFSLFALTSLGYGYNDSQSEIPTTHITFSHSIKPEIHQLIEVNPVWILGSYDLFQWDDSHEKLILSDSFQALLNLLRDLRTLESSEFHDLNALNKALQKPQGEGGLLRKPGTERWQILENPVWSERRTEILRLLSQLGFMRGINLPSPIAVHHCLIFGASAPGIETRMQKTLELMQNGVLKAEKIFLLGSNRPLVREELNFLESRMNTLSPSKRGSYWQEIFSKRGVAVEADALLFLWELLAPLEMQKRYEGNVVTILSTRIGFSYRDTEGHRSTTAVTADDWLSYYHEGEQQSIFALAEQPYGRLLDQLRVQLLTRGYKANINLLKQRMAQTTFHFVQPVFSEEQSIGVYLDEIARNVYRIAETMQYLDH